jgi:hypothetical protein
VRTQTLVKNAIIQIDAAPFKQWYQQHYGLELGQKKGAETAETAEAKVRRGCCVLFFIVGEGLLCLVPQVWGRGQKVLHCGGGGRRFFIVGEGAEGESVGRGVNSAGAVGWSRVLRQLRQKARPKGEVVVVLGGEVLGVRGDWAG